MRLNRSGRMGEGVQLEMGKEESRITKKKNGKHKGREEPKKNEE